MIRIIREGFKDDTTPNMKYYAFDWDDNIVHMPTKIMVLSSDGVFYKFTSQEVVTFIQNKIAASDYSDILKIARELANECIYGKNVRDNITIIIIALNRGLVNV